MTVGTFPEHLVITIPACTRTLDGFRAWVDSDSFPERGQISFLQQEILIDMSPEDLETHNQMKREINEIIGLLVKQLDLGKYFPDGLWLTNDAAQLSTEPDATFVSWECFEKDRVKIIPSKRDIPLEMRGTPDWVLEIVSHTSVAKDTKKLPLAYHAAGIPEFWLIDARGDELQFTIFHHRPEAYVPAADEAGWLCSEVFDRLFRLDRHRDRIGGWQYTLHVQQPDA